MKVVFIALLALLSFSTIPAYADNFDPAGGSGDRQDPDSCPDNSYLAGARYRSGNWLDQIQIACVRMAKDGTTGTPFFPTSSRGGNGGDSGEATCPSNQV